MSVTVSKSAAARLAGLVDATLPPGTLVEKADEEKEAEAEEEEEETTDPSSLKLLLPPNAGLSEEHKLPAEARTDGLPSKEKKGKKFLFFEEFVSFLIPLQI